MTKIDWCDITINPFTGCRGGCSWCYARRMARRLGSIPGSVYERVKNSGIDEDPFEVAFHWDVLQREQERLTKYRRGGMHAGYTVRPRRVFVGSMGDMCFKGTARSFGGNGERFSDLFTLEVQNETAKWSERVGAAGHTVLLLTKRPDLLSLNIRWPANVHLGVSVTSNADTERIATLLDKVRVMREQVGPSCLGGKRGPSVLWASVEPLLDTVFDPDLLAGLDWVVVGFQTGPGASDAWPMIAAARRIVSWCADYGVPCFVKDNARRWTLGPSTAWEWPRQFPVQR